MRDPLEECSPRIIESFSSAIDEGSIVPEGKHKKAKETQLDVNLPDLFDSKLSQIEEEDKSVFIEIHRSDSERLS